MTHYAGTHGVAPGRQLVDMLTLWVSNGVGPLEYYLLGLFRPAVPRREKLNTVSGARYWKQVQRINPAELRTLATNKIASNLLLRSAGIATPVIHGVFDRERGLTTEWTPLRTPDDVAGLVRRRGLAEVCFKPISAWSGGGFVKVTFEADGDTIRARAMPSGATLPLDEFCATRLDPARYGSYVIQDILHQHPDIDRFHPSSLNTLRTWMYQPKPGRWEMFCANLRMGIDDMTVDNSSAGGIGAAVDVASGRLGTAARRSFDPDRGEWLQEFTAHPTTGVRIVGETVPMWPEVLDVCRRACELFPYRFMAVDVGVGPDRPWVVEVEADPHYYIQLYCSKGLRPLLESARRS